MENVESAPRRKAKFLPKFPWLLVLVLVWMPAKAFGVSMSTGQWTGVAFMLLAIMCGIIEIYKGADVGIRTFKYELFTSLLAAVLTAVFWCMYLVPKSAIQVADVVMTIMVVADAWFSPTVAYATALRNFAANTDPN